MKAFPVVKYVKSQEFGAHVMAIEGGMDLRDYFAASAINGLLSRDSFDSKTAANLAYDYADAMMRARGTT